MKVAVHLAEVLPVPAVRQVRSAPRVARAPRADAVVRQARKVRKVLRARRARPVHRAAQVRRADRDAAVAAGAAVAVAPIVRTGMPPTSSVRTLRDDCIGRAITSTAQTIAAIAGHASAPI